MPSSTGSFQCNMSSDQQSLFPSSSSSAVRPYIATGRRTWKNLKGKDEAVWPPYIEAVLIEALEKYCPGPSANTKILGRFPKRNRFISDYIFSATSKRRSPKQVGSRIQQLRDTCEDGHIQALLSRTRYLQDKDSSPETQACSPTSSDGSHSSSECSLDVGISPTRVFSASSLEAYSFPPSGQVSEIASTPHPHYNKSSTVTSHFSHPFMGVSIDILSGSVSVQDLNTPANYPFVISSVTPRPLQHLRPSVTFVSPTLLSTSNHYSSFVVFLDGSAVYSEITRFAIRPEPSTVESQGSSKIDGQGQFVYETGLAPGYWRTIAESLDVTQYTMLQNIMRAPYPINDAVPTVSTQDTVIMSIQYQFDYPQSPTSYPSPASSLSDGAINPSLHYSYTDSDVYLQPVSPVTPIAEPERPLSNSECYFWPTDRGDYYSSSHSSAGSRHTSWHSSPDTLAAPTYNRAVSDSYLSMTANPRHLQHSNSLSSAFSPDPFGYSQVGSIVA